MSLRRGFQLRAAVLLVLGSAALLAAVAVRLGWARRVRPHVPTTGPRRRASSPAAAAAAGVLTHLPGVFYLAALGAIIGSGAAPRGWSSRWSSTTSCGSPRRSSPSGSPSAGTIPSGDRLVGVLAWGRAHEEAILTLCFAGVGVWLIAKGVAGLG